MHLAPVTDSHDDDHDAAVDDLGDHAVVAQPVLPEAAEFLPETSVSSVSSLPLGGGGVNWLQGSS